MAKLEVVYSFDEASSEGFVCTGHSSTQGGSKATRSVAARDVQAYWR
jgi:hypothetical protein